MTKNEAKRIGMALAITATIFIGGFLFVNDLKLPMSSIVGMSEAENMRSVESRRMTFEKGKTYAISEVFDPDKREIIAAIESKTKDRILLITVMEDGSLKVRTGVEPGPLAGGGMIYILKLKNGHWELFDDGSIRGWIS
jgi:hypothetical protein